MVREIQIHVSPHILRIVGFLAHHILGILGSQIQTKGIYFL
jgi:hypothetical protein